MAKKQLTPVGFEYANGGYGGQSGHFRRMIAYPGIGAGNVSFLPGVTLPVYDFRGPGIVPSFNWMVTQTPQVWQGLNVPGIGLPGVINGQTVGQKLIDMRNADPATTRPFPY